MAHMSMGETAKIRMKNINIQRAKDEQRENEKQYKMTPEKLKEYLLNKQTKTYRTRAANIMWDFEQNQVPRAKKADFKLVLEARLKEIENNFVFKKEADKIQSVLREI